MGSLGPQEGRVAQAADRSRVFLNKPGHPWFKPKGGGFWLGLRGLGLRVCGLSILGSSRKGSGVQGLGFRAYPWFKPKGRTFRVFKGLRVALEAVLVRVHRGFSGAFRV